MPLVSVIVPVHNSAGHLEECLLSIQQQTFTDFEIILVDDGSTDGSVDILARFAAAEPRARIISGPATGSAGSARNVGMEVATGEYVSFLDSDDLFAPTLLEELHRRAVEDDADVVLSKFQEFHEPTGEIIPADWSLRLDLLPRIRPFSPRQVADYVFDFANPAAWNKLFRASFVHANQLRFQSLQRANDACFTLLALAKAERLTYLDRVLVTYRTATADSLQGTIDSAPLQFIQALEGVRTGLLEAGLFPTFERAFVNLALTMGVAALKRPRTIAGFLEIYRAFPTAIVDEFGIAGRPPEYFLRESLVASLQAILGGDPNEFLFNQLHQAREDLITTRAELRRTVRGSDARARAGSHSAPSSPPPPAATSDPTDSSGPDLSVIVPVYNTELFLRECLDSVLRQTGLTLELICVDDGSSDGSPVLLDQYAARDSRVVVIRQQNTGLSAARNAGIKVATGRYLCFLDSDDYWRTDGASILVAHADQQHLDVYAFDAASLREKGVDEKLWKKYAHFYERAGGYSDTRSGLDLLARLVESGDYRASACLYLVRRSLLKRQDLRFYPGITHEDNLFTFNLMHAAERAAHTSTPLYARRVRKGSITTEGKRLESTTDYLISCLTMLRSISGKRYADPRVAEAVGRVVASMFTGARRSANRLPLDLIEQLRSFDEGADAATIHRLLLRAWRDDKASRLSIDRLKRFELAESSQPPPPSGKARKLAQRLIRRLTRLGTTPCSKSPVVEKG